MPKIRHLHLVLGDQLDHRSALFDDFDGEEDAVWMAEVAQEAEHVWCHQLRIAFFFSAMRHFRDELDEKGRRVHYTELAAKASDDAGGTFGEVLRKDAKRLKPEKLIVVQPGDHRVEEELQAAAEALGIDLEIRDDNHFYDTPSGFRDWADGRKSLLLETYYRHMRKKHGILLTDGNKPAGGEWNFDKENRETFGKEGPPDGIKAPRRFSPDQTTGGVLELVKKRFGDHPGTLEHFDLPVCRADALKWLREFVQRRLPEFGTHQDAMWTGEHFLYHSRLSCLLNVKLLDPRECIEKAVQAYEDGDAPINSVEGFVRQILGWREFTRGIYWLHMPGYLGKNFFGAEADLPSFYWDGETEMECVRDAMQNVLAHGYAHHIQRLMVLGLFAQIYGADPRKFHDWHMAMYLDAIDWVSAPNTIGMSQFADGGIVGTKPYCASGNYINRMSNYCGNCRYNPKKASGEDACPFTTFYWEFLGRTYEQIKDNRRMVFQVKNYEKKSDDDLEAISERAAELRREWA
ncbi:MAG: cryptochrome/photolyase family protein [Akkermansiaceae bacterium]|nr:cryptochrome/photolyase family protein [Akkermansiaceae bacterium]